MADTKISALSAVSSVAGANELAVNESGTSKKASVTQLATFLNASPALTGTPTAPTASAGTNSTQVATTAYVDNIIKRATGTSTAAAEYATWLTLSSNSSAITDTTLTTVMTITGVGVGTWHFTCQMIWQQTVTSVGIDVAVNHTGTVTAFLAEHRFSSTGTTASTAAATEASTNATGNTYEGQGVRTKNTIIGGGSVSVDAASSDMLSTIEGYMVVSVSGDIQIKITNETATGSPSMTARAGSFLELKKVA